MPVDQIPASRANNGITGIFRGPHPVRPARAERDGDLTYMDYAVVRRIADLAIFHPLRSVSQAIGQFAAGLGIESGPPPADVRPSSAQSPSEPSR